MTSTLAYIPSPAQGVWYLGPFPIRAYAFCIIIGIIAALILGDRRWRARGGEAGVIYDIALWAVPFGLIGGRLYHVITDWEKYFGEDGVGLMGALRIWEGGLGIWGAVALGGVGAWIACRRRNIPLPAFGDAIAPGIILAQAIGRLGNYFNQELYGRQTTVPWGLEIFQRVPDDLNGVSNGVLVQIVHPTFLYELLWNLLIFAVLLYVDRRFSIGHGRLFALYVAGYCLGRFWIELLRSDFATEFAGIRVNSFTSGFVFIGAVVYMMAAPKGREDPATLGGTAAATKETADEDTTVDELIKGLAGASAAVTGVVAAAKVADRDDAAEVADEQPEAVLEAEALTADVAEAPAEDIAEAEEFAVAGEAADEVGGVGAVEGEDAVEAEASVEEAHEAAVEGVDEAAAVEAEVAEEEPEAAVVGGVGAVEGEDAVEAEASVEEAHEAAVEGVEEASAVEAEATADDAEDAETPPVGEDPTAAADADALTVDADDTTEPTDTASDATEDADGIIGENAAAAAPSDALTDETSGAAETEAVGGVGTVEGDEAVQAEEAAAEVHSSTLKSVDKAKVTAPGVPARRRWWRRNK